MSIDFTNPAGKGSQPRPFSDYETYKSNWDNIFGKKEKNDNSEGTQKETIPVPTRDQS